MGWSREGAERFLGFRRGVSGDVWIGNQLNTVANSGDEGGRLGRMAFEGGQEFSRKGSLYILPSKATDCSRQAMSVVWRLEVILGDL